MCKKAYMLLACKHASAKSKGHGVPNNTQQYNSLLASIVVSTEHAYVTFFERNLVQVIL